MPVGAVVGSTIGATLGYLGASQSNRRLRDAQKQVYRGAQERQRGIQQHAAFRRFQAQRAAAQREGALRAVVGKGDVGTMGMFGQIDFNQLYNQVVINVDTASQMAASLSDAIAQVTRLQTGVQSPGLSAVQGAISGASAGAALEGAMKTGGTGDASTNSEYVTFD